MNGTVAQLVEHLPGTQAVCGFKSRPSRHSLGDVMNYQEAKEKLDSKCTITADSDACDKNCKECDLDTSNRENVFEEMFRGQ